MFQIGQRVAYFKRGAKRPGYIGTVTSGPYGYAPSGQPWVQVLTSYKTTPIRKVDSACLVAVFPSSVGVGGKRRHASKAKRAGKPSRLSRLVADVNKLTR